MMETLPIQNRGCGIMKYANELLPLSKVIFSSLTLKMDHPNLTNRVSFPMLSEAKNVMEALPTQNREGDIANYTN